MSAAVPARPAARVLLALLALWALLAAAAGPAQAQAAPRPLPGLQALVQTRTAACGQADGDAPVRTEWLGPAHLRAERTLSLAPRIELLDGPGEAALQGRTLVLTHFYRVRDVATDRPTPSCLRSATVSVDLLGLPRRRHPDLAVRIVARQRTDTPAGAAASTAPTAP